MGISEAEGRFELAILHSQSTGVDFVDIATDMINSNVPTEVVTRLGELWKKTKNIAGQVYSIGKILVLKIWDFIKKNPGFSIGLALGAAIGALTHFIPFIGSLIAPVAIAAGAFLGGVAGMQLDKVAKGEAPSDSLVQYLGDVINIACDFFKLIVDIFRALSVHFSE